MKTILLSFFFISLHSIQLFAQKSINCRILDAAIHNKVFIEHFHINKSDEPLIIIDTNSYFTNCHSIQLKQRAIKLSREYPQNVDINKGGGEENRNEIVIYNVVSNGKCFNISFWQPYGNANMILHIKLRKKKTKVKVISLGVF